MALGDDIANFLAGNAQVPAPGNTTLVNGASIAAKWAEVQANRVQQFLADFNWDHAYYLVRFGGGAVLFAPYSLHADQEITWATMGVSGVVRRISWVGGPADTVAKVTALVEIM